MFQAFWNDCYQCQPNALDLFFFTVFKYLLYFYAAQLQLYMEKVSRKQIWFALAFMSYRVRHFNLLYIYLVALIWLL